MNQAYFKIRQSFELTRLLSDAAGKHLLSGSTLQLWIILLKEYTETNQVNIQMPLQRFCALRGIHDVKYARKKLAIDLKQLILLQWITGICGIENNVLHCTLSPSIVSLVPQTQFMYLPDEVLHTQRNENLAARLLLTWRICQHKRMNLDRTNTDTITVHSLLESCPVIPAPSQLGTAGQIEKRIIDPFEKVLDRCDAFSWEYAVRIITKHIREKVFSRMCYSFVTKPGRVRAKRFRLQNTLHGSVNCQFSRRNAPLAPEFSLRQKGCI